MNSSYMDIFLTFMQIGLFTFGGGPSMLPIAEKYLIEKNGWVTEEELLDYYSVGQCTPGIIMINTATFVGYKLKGIKGSLVATFAIILPPLVIITALSSILKHFQHIPAVRSAFIGIRVAVCAMITKSIAKLLKKAVIDIPTAIFFIAAAVAAFAFALTPYLIVAAGILLGLLSGAIVRRKEKQ